VPSGESRGLGFTARATEVFHQRGLLARFGDVETSRQGHFGGIPLDFGVLEGGHFGVRGVPQYRVERMLEDWAVELDRLTNGKGVALITDPLGGNHWRKSYKALRSTGRLGMFGVSVATFLASSWIMSSLR